MNCRVTTNIHYDKAYWVSREKFEKYFDKKDFECRDQLHVVESYLQDWFVSGEDGIVEFLVAPVGIRDGKTQFISGRHRTAVLLKYLEIIPISFDNRYFTLVTLEWIDEATEGCIEEGTMISLPDLPVKKELP